MWAQKQVHMEVAQLLMALLTREIVLLGLELEAKITILLKHRVQ